MLLVLIDIPTGIQLYHVVSYYGTSWYVGKLLRYKLVCCYKLVYCNGFFKVLGQGFFFKRWNQVVCCYGVFNVLSHHFFSNVETKWYIWWVVIVRVGMWYELLSYELVCCNGFFKVLSHGGFFQMLKPSGILLWFFQSVK